MQTNTPLDGSVHGCGSWLAQLSDADLLAGTRRLVGRSNHLLAELLVHLGEVEARGIHRTRACSSLYAYCIYELRFSEDEAFRRVAATRLVRRFPVLLDALASGELHLTGLLMLGPHLTETNLVEVLSRAKHRTKRELARLVRVLDPLPAVPARIEPLGPTPARLVPPEPSWQAFIDSTCPVRELAPGERPREWLESANDWNPSPLERGVKAIDAGASARASAPGDGEECVTVGATITAPERAAVPATIAAPERVTRPANIAAPERLLASPRVLEPEQYKVQFTASEEYVRLVEEAQALLSHAVPNVTLEELHMRAMRALVAELKKKKYATRDSSPARMRALETVDAPSRAASRTRPETVNALDHGLQRTHPLDQEVHPVDAPDQRVRRTDAPDPVDEQPNPRRRVRHIPAAVRRIVFERDGNRCSYLDANGARCRETHRLEFHHLKPFAMSGAHCASNLTLRCAAHNALAAEEDFGRELMEHTKNSLQHEPFGSFHG